MEFIKQLFRIESNPKRGLTLVEWVVMAYLLFTLAMTVIMRHRVPNPDSMIQLRLSVAVTTAALWTAYRLIPCRFMMMVRIGAQMAFLAMWYPDTFELNRTFQNLDHVFAAWEQQWFNCQPALLFSQKLPSPVISELLDLGYAAYYPMIAAVTVYFFAWRYKDFERATFIIMASFFIYYLIFIFVPVVGPTYYYCAAGLQNITSATFPPMNDYFNYHQECLPSPGYSDGLFYHLVEQAKEAGERPTAAFPSSHVGISTVLMWLLVKARNYKLLLWLLPLYVLLCLATVYIQAHYLVDAIFGFISGTLFFWLLMLVRFPEKPMKTKSHKR